MAAGAPRGNKNAEKWDLEKARQLFIDSLELCKQKEQYIVQGKLVEGYAYDFIGELACELDTFKEIYTHLADRFPEELSELYNKLKTRTERNCYSNTKKGIIKEGTGIVNLKANHNWSDRSVVKHEGEIKTNTTIIVQTNEEATTIKNAIDALKNEGK